MFDQTPAGQQAPLNLNTYTKAGYSFSGWNTQADGSGLSYANNALYSFSGATTLYAQWSPTELAQTSAGQSSQQTSLIMAIVLLVIGLSLIMKTRVN